MAIAYRAGSTAGNASGGNLTITKPSGTADGDILVAVCYNEISAAAWTAPSGWAQWGSGFADNATGGVVMWVNIYWKRASSEGANYTFSISTTWRIIAMGAFSGCLASGDPIDVGPTGYNTTLGVVTATSITTTTANTMRVVGMGTYDGDDIAAGTSGMTQGAGLGGCEIWYLAQASAGASGNKVFGSTTASGNWATAHLALKEATGAAGIAIPVLMAQYRQRRM